MKKEDPSIVEVPINYSGYYKATESRYNSGSLTTGPSTSSVEYEFEVTQTGSGDLIFSNLYEEGSEVNGTLDGNAITIANQSFDGFLTTEGNGSITDGILHINYVVNNPDGYVECELTGGKLAN